MAPLAHATEPKRSQTRFDSYALFDLARDYELPSLARLTLITLCMLADFRDRCYRGTIAELAERTGSSTNTVRRALDVLEEVGLVKTSMPFSANRARLVEILCWGDLIVSKSDAQISATDSGGRSPVAQRSRSGRATAAQISGTNRLLTSEKGVRSKKQGGKEQGEGWWHEDSDDRWGEGCPTCGELADGHDGYCRAHEPF